MAKESRAKKRGQETVAETSVVIERVMVNPATPAVYSNAVFSSRVGQELVLDFAQFDPASFHEAKLHDEKQVIPAFVTYRVLISRLSVERLKGFLETYLEDVAREVSGDEESL